MGINEILPLLRKYGNASTAYHSLQPGLEHFLMEGVGFVPFKRIRREQQKELILVSGNPIAASEQRAQLLTAFLARYPQAAFFQVDQTTATLLHELGSFVNEFGVETMLRLPYHLNGGRRADIRLLFNRAKAANVRVLELESGNRMQYGIRDDDIAELSRSWVRSRIANHKEFSFLSRSFRYQDEPDCRKFYAVCDGRLVGLAVFDPMYEGNEIVGYAEVIARTNPVAPKGTRDFLLVSALEKMAGEGVKAVSLGLSPLALVSQVNEGTEHLRRSLFVGWCFDFMYRKLDGVVFNFQGLSFKKGRYAKQLRPDEGGIEKRFCAFHTKFPLAELYFAYLQTSVSPFRPLLSKPVRTLSTAVFAAEELIANPRVYLG